MRDLAQQVSSYGTVTSSIMENDGLPDLREVIYGGVTCVAVWQPCKSCVRDTGCPATCGQSTREVILRAEKKRAFVFEKVDFENLSSIQGGPFKRGHLNIFVNYDDAKNIFCLTRMVYLKGQ
ncbi:hypothetical protein K0M31_007935 [Melipona bicolor]|uniref:Uncharacterized protein n=1 Tax=Melipona bicolor TaxID=60889 RepID=A0AA40KWH7_9HYME|nr:hypothetical protein K0M31_007935 [Melipona bicolor]